MIFKDLSLEQRITEANTVIVSRPSTDIFESPIAFRNGSSAVVYEFPKNNFEEWLENPTLTFIKSITKENKEIEDIFVSPVKSSIKVKMKVRISGKVSPIPVDLEDIIFFDE